MLLGTTTASADEIALYNGDRFTGTVVRMVKGNLTFKTEYFNPVEIRLCTIKKIVTDSSVEVHLSSGEVMKGTLSSEKDGQITIYPSDPMTAMTVDIQNIVSINPPLIKWDGGITLAGNMQTGKIA